MEAYTNLWFLCYTKSKKNTKHASTCLGFILITGEEMKKQKLLNMFTYKVHMCEDNISLCAYRC